MNDRERIRPENQRARDTNGPLFDEVVALLFEMDPMHINLGDNTDEYQAEARTILPRLNQCGSVDDVQKVVHEEFTRWFSPLPPKPENAYQEIAETIWALWSARPPPEE